MQVPTKIMYRYRYLCSSVRMGSRGIGNTLCNPMLQGVRGGRGSRGESRFSGGGGGDG